MAYEVIMPKAGMAMETGTIVKWLKKEGDPVENGEPLLEIETDKVNMEVESMYSGVLLKVLAQEGEEVPVTKTIGYIGFKGETVPEGVSAVAEQTPEIQCETTEKTENTQTVINRIPATPAAKHIAKEKGINLDNIEPSGYKGQIKAADVLRPDIKVTPLAASIASKNGIDLAGIPGSGYGGKITKEDLAEEMRKNTAMLMERGRLIPHTAMRSVIAKRMLQSHTEIPTVTQSCFADVTGLLALREKLNAGGEQHISVNDFVIMAAAKALKEQPHLNASYTQEGLLLKGNINIGMAVALQEGLIVPVIRDADMLTLSQISAQSKMLSQKAKEGKLTPDEYSGGTFTVSNLGMLGVTSFTPIINQPEIAILGVCAIQQKLEMDDKGNIEKRFKMGLSLTYDHRCIDGAQAAVFSKRITAFLEEPLLMFI